ncbi:MAG: isocitrate/isopropylmalate dehydrogenase family protein [Dethiobacteria bacterium]
MHKVTLIQGDGIGPEIVAATLTVVEATGVKIAWEEAIAGEEALEKYGTPLPEETLVSLQKNKVGLKGPLTTPIGSGYRSINVALRKALDLYANLRPAKSYPGVNSPYREIDLVVVRENTEDLYAGVEHMVGPDAAESIKIITRRASERIVRYAFEYARQHNRRKVTAVHKANILKLSDGLFLETARSVAAQYPEIEFEERIVDNMAMQLVQKPHLYDVMVMPNLYGDILSDLCAGLVGGLGVAPSANVGDTVALFEPVHGSAPKYRGEDKVNPTAMILTAALMLRYLGEEEAASRIERAVAEVLREGKTVTYDLGGSAGTAAMGRAIADKVRSNR